MVYEDEVTGELVLNFYTSSFEGDKTLDFEYSQKPLQQTWRIDYPLLAYKCASPDNREIAIVHLGQNMPQRIITMYGYEFVSFVQGAMQRDTIAKQIIFLARSKTNAKELKLVIIEIDPWKAIKSDEPFDLPETCFIIQGHVAQPPKTVCPREYSDDKIRDIQVLVK